MDLTPKRGEGGRCFPPNYPLVKISGSKGATKCIEIFNTTVFLVGGWGGGEGISG